MTIFGDLSEVPDIIFTSYQFLLSDWRGFTEFNLSDDEDIDTLS